MPQTPTDLQRRPGRRARRRRRRDQDKGRRSFSLSAHTHTQHTATTHARRRSSSPSSLPASKQLVEITVLVLVARARETNGQTPSLHLLHSRLTRLSLRSRPSKRGRRSPPTTTHPTPLSSAKLEAEAGFLDDAQLEDAFFHEEDVLLLSAEDAAAHDFAMGNAASTDQSGAASGAASAGAPGSAGGAGGDASLAPPVDNPGFARVQGVTAARADGQRTKPRGPPVQASQYEFLQVSAVVWG